MAEGTATRTTSATEKVLLWLGQWAGLLACWLLFAGSSAVPEIVAGAAGAAIAATASLLVWAEDLAHLSVEPRSLAQAWRLPKYVVTGTWEILSVLFRDLFTRSKAPSILRAVRYDLVGDDARSATFRALAIGYTTITPNFVVLGVDRHRRYLLFHQVRRSEVPRMTRNVGARP